MTEFFKNYSTFHPSNDKKISCANVKTCTQAFSCITKLHKDPILKENTKDGESARSLMNTLIQSTEGKTKCFLPSNNECKPDLKNTVVGLQRVRKSNILQYIDCKGLVNDTNLWKVI